MKRRSSYVVFSVLVIALICAIAVSIVVYASDEGMTFDNLAEYKTKSVDMALPLSFEATVRFPNDFEGKGGVILGSYTDDNTAGFNFAIGDGGAPSLCIIDGAKVRHDVRFDGVSVYTGEKVHIAIVLDRAGGSYALYINGRLESTVTASVPEDFTTTAVFNLGTDNTAGDLDYFRGELFGVALYADARGVLEVANDAKGEIDQSELIAAYSPLSKETGGASITAMGDARYDITYTCDWIRDVADPRNYDYSMAVIGDIQSMTYYYPELLVKQFEWIRDNQAAKKIAFSVGLGDITEKNTAAEYEKVIEAYDKIDGKIPFSIIRGNHERDRYNSTELYDRYITLERYGDEITASMDDRMHNTYRIIRIGEVSYMFMNLDLVLSDEAIAWANEIIAEHPECHVIVSTHSYKNMSGSYLDYSDGTYGVENSSITLWNELLSRHENIVMVLYGHSPKDTLLYKQRNDTVHGNTVTEMLINPSSIDIKWGGTGMVAMFYFSEDGKKLDVRYYSTAKEAFFIEKNQFTLTLDTPDTPVFENVIMNVGADESERNLTWYSQFETVGEVRYGISTDGDLPEEYMTVPAVASSASKQGFYSYKATLVGLEENSTYVYKLVVGGTASDAFTFDVHDMGEEWNFAFITDPQVKESSHAALWDDTLDKLKNKFDGVSFIVSGGDQTSDPASELNFDWFISEHLSSIAIATTVGPPHDNTQLYKNHYNLPNQSSIYGISTPSSDYFYTYNNVLFMHMNIENHDYAAHAEFLERTIKDNPECPWRVVVLHYSFFTGGNHSSDGSVIACREAMAGKFAELGIDVVLSGHDHIYSRSHLMTDGTTVSSDVVTNNTVTDPEGVLYLCGTSSTGSGWYSVDHHNDDQYIAYREDANRKSVTIFSVTETSLTLKTYFIDGAEGEEYDSFTINKTKAPVSVGEDEMIEILDDGVRVPLVNAYLSSSAIVKVHDGYWSISTNDGASFTSLGIASDATDMLLRINEETGYWELSQNGGASFDQLPIYSRRYTIKFVTVPGATYGDATDLSVFSTRRYTDLTPDAPMLHMPNGSVKAGKLYDWSWEYYLADGDGTAVTEFAYGEEYLAYPVSSDTPVSDTLYLDMVNSPLEYTYTWSKAWEIVERCVGTSFTLVLKNDVTLTAEDAIALATPMDMTIDLAGNRLDTAACTYAIRFAVGSNGSDFTVITSSEGGRIYSGANNIFELGSNQGSVITVQYGSEDTKPVTVEQAKYLVGSNNNFKYGSTLNLTVYPGSYTVGAGIIYIANVSESAGGNNYKVNLKDADFSFLGQMSAIVRTRGISYESSAASFINAVGCSFTDTYSSKHNSSRAVFRDDVWYGTASFVDCNFIGMSVGTDSTGTPLQNCGTITVGEGCSFTNSKTSFGAANPLVFASGKIAIASGCVLARTDAVGSAEVIPLSDAVEISWENPVGYKDYWKRGVTPAYLGETSFTVGEKTYSLVLIETPVAANENKAYAFKSNEGYLYRYDSKNAVWQISTDGGNSYVNLDGSGSTVTPEPDYGCAVTIDGVSTTYSADVDFTSVFASFNSSANAGKTVKIVLGDDMSFATSLTFNRAITVEIDLAGHKLTHESGSRLKVASGYTIKIYSSVAGGEFVFGNDGDGFQSGAGTLIFGSEEYKNNLTVSTLNEILNPGQTADGSTLHFEFLYCTVNTGANSLIRINAKGAAAITLEMKIVGCTVVGNKSVICYNYSSTLGATANGGVCNASSYIDVVDTSFISTSDAPVDFFGSPNFTDRYFGTVSFEGTSFDNYVLNGDLIYSDGDLGYNAYYTNNLAGTDYDPTKSITVGGGCVFRNYGSTFTEDLSRFAASNVSVADGCRLVGDAEGVTVSDAFGCTVEIDGVVTVFDKDEDFYNVFKLFNTSSHVGKTVKITLGADMHVKTKITFNRAANVEIDLAGHRLVYEAGGVFQIGATKLHIYSSIAGGELALESKYGFQPVGGAIIFGSEEYKHNLTVSATGELLNPKQTADGRTLHYEFLYCTVNFGTSNLIRINAIGAGAITFEMRIVGCTVTSDKSVICYNYSSTLGATTNGGVCNTDSYIEVIDTSFISTADAPTAFFGSPNFTDRYFGTVSFEGTTFNNYVLNGDLICSDEDLGYNSYYTNNLAGTDYDPTKAITVGGGCVFYNYGSTFTEDLSGFIAQNTSLSNGCVIKTTGDYIEIVSVPQITSASMTIGTSLAMNYRVSLPDGYTADMLSMRFTMNGKVLTVSASTLFGEECVFTLTSIAPQCMGDGITAELMQGGTVIQVHENYSVKVYLEHLLELYPEDEYIRNIVRDMLNYGAAAQLYVNYKTDALVNSSLDGEESNALPTELDKANTITKSTNESYTFISAGVRFDYVNKVYVKFSVSGGASPDDVVTVTVNGRSMAIGALSDGMYIVYSEDISALSFADVLTFELKVNGATVQTLTYSVNSYAYSKHDDGDKMGNLALALYRYGLSAVAYNENK